MSQKYTLNSETETRFFNSQIHLYMLRFIACCLQIQDLLRLYLCQITFTLRLFNQKPIHIEYQVNFLRFRSLD